MDTKNLKYFLPFVVCINTLYGTPLSFDPVLKRYLDRQHISCVEPLMGGQSYDRLFKLKKGHSTFVLRILNTRRSPEKRKLICEATRIIGERGLGPQVVWMDDSYRFLITRFISGSYVTISDIKDPVVFEKFVSLLRESHETVSQIPIDLEFYSLKEQVLQRVSELLRYLPKYQPLLELKDFLGHIKIDRKWTIVHGDIKKTNILKSGNHLFLIDWGEVTRASVYEDLGAFSFHFGLKKEEQFKLLYLYFKEKPTQHMIRALKWYHWLSEVHHILWNIRKKRGNLEKHDHEFLSGWQKDVKYLDIL